MRKIDYKKKFYENVEHTEQLNVNSGEALLNFVFQTKARPSGSKDESSYEANNNSGYLKELM